MTKIKGEERIITFLYCICGKATTHCGLMCEKDSERFRPRAQILAAFHTVSKCPSWELVTLKSLILFQLPMAQRRTLLK